MNKWTITEIKKKKQNPLQTKYDSDSDPEYLLISTNSSQK